MTSHLKANQIVFELERKDSILQNKRFSRKKTTFAKP
jgi:hypothetical protein